MTEVTDARALLLFADLKRLVTDIRSVDLATLDQVEKYVRYSGLPVAIIYLMINFIDLIETASADAEK